MKKVIVIVGPTAVGKSHIAIELAKKLNTEIISGDSVQVYRGLDIGSGKVTKEEMDGIPHHLIDIIDIGTPYSVSDFQTSSRALIDKIDVPIVCGGTGLYIKAMLTNYVFNGKRRDEDFALKYQDVDNETLYQKLLDLDPEQAKLIHPNNRKRVLRALEMALDDTKLSGNRGKDEYLYEPFIIYLNASRDFLREKIDKRVDQMVLNGLIEENKRLFDSGLNVNAIGYKEFDGYFENKKTIDEVKAEIKLNSIHLAKRQQTWFNHQMRANFYMVDEMDATLLFDKIYEDVSKFLKGDNLCESI